MGNSTWMKPAAMPSAGGAAVAFAFAAVAGAGAGDVQPSCSAGYDPWLPHGLCRRHPAALELPRMAHAPVAVGLLLCLHLVLPARRHPSGRLEHEHEHCVAMSGQRRLKTLHLHPGPKRGDATALAVTAAAEQACLAQSQRLHHAAPSAARVEVGA